MLCGYVWIRFQRSFQRTGSGLYKRIPHGGRRLQLRRRSLRRRDYLTSSIIPRLTIIYRTSIFSRRRSKIPDKEEVIRWDLNGTYTNDIIAQGLKDSLAIKDASKPTFTFLSLQAVHSPLQAPEKYIEMYRHIKDKHRRNYNAMTTAMDDMIGDVIQTYKDLARFRIKILNDMSRNL